MFKGTGETVDSTNSYLLFNIREADHAQRITELLPKVNLSYASVLSDLNNLRNQGYIKIHNADRDMPASVVRYFTKAEKRDEIDNNLKQELKHLKGRLYFAYGSNLDPAQMYERCPSSQFIMRAEAKGYELIFPLSSSNWDGGVAGIRPNEAERVWGVIYHMTPEDWPKMDHYEGSNYSRREIKVCTNLGIIEAETYFPVNQDN